MSSRSGGPGNKKKGGAGNNAGGAGSSSTGAISRNSNNSQCQSVNVDSKSGDGDNGSMPLESRMMEIRDANGCIKLVPALDKRWVPSMNYIEFYLPSCKTLLEDETSLLTWLDYMDMYSKDLEWLLSVPHHKFWSMIVYAPEVPQVVLQSFLLRAPQWYDKEFPFYLKHDVIGPRYQDIYSLIFRVFLRLCTYKENRQDFISPITWASLLTDHQIIDVLKLQTLCCLYDSESNAILPKMIENVLKYCPKLVTCFRNLIPVLLSKSEEMTEELRSRIRESTITDDWNLEVYEEILSFFLSTTCGLYKFAKVYTPIAEIVMKFPNALMKLAVTYEPNCCKLWNQVAARLPDLKDRVMLLRVLLIRLFRVGLANPTIMQVTASNDPRIDEYFEVLTNCLDEKTFIRDYEKTYPFKQDVNTLLSRGVFIDETRIDYIANAISSCFHACGEDYAVEKIVVDPLYDPNFDRQLLGACSLDVTGAELTSLVTQVKDILPDLPDSYVEVVLKHYGYQAEAAINALLEGSVPSRLEKYKNETYLLPNNPEFTTDSFVSEDTELEKLASKLMIQDAEADGEKFFPGKRSHGFDDRGHLYGEDDFSEIKPRIKDLLNKMNEEPHDKEAIAARNKYSSKLKSSQMDQDSKPEQYLDESLLPSYRISLEYEDEYDDTYDEVSVGMTEPDNIKPLNYKMQGGVDADDEEEEDEEPSKDTKKLDIYEDPAIVRARLERRREEKMQHHRRGPPSSNDVVGRAKGQGQEKDVLYARRQKNVNKDPGGYKKKRADFKRREF